MKKLALLLAVALTGCENSAHIYSQQLDMATAQCSGRNGVWYIDTAGTVRNSYAGHYEYNVAGACNDRSEFTLRENVSK